MSSSNYQPMQGTSFKWLLIELADEYFWVNALLAAQWAICADGFLYCNPNRTYTLACALDLTTELLVQCWKSGYQFIRKVEKVDDASASLLKNIYEQAELHVVWM